MNESESQYQSKILDLATNRYLDQIAPPSKANLNYMESNVDEIVWKVATQIYQQSGFKADLTRVRDIVISRIDNLRVEEKRKAAKEAQRVARLRAAEKRQAEEEAQRAARWRAEAERKAAEEAQRKAEEEAQRAAMWRAEPERKAAEEAQRAAERLEKLNKEEIFIKIRKIVAEELEIDESVINVDTNIVQDLETTVLEAFEIITSIEEEFDIEISDEEIEEISGNTEELKCYWDISDKFMKLNFVVRKLMNHIYKKIYETTETE